MADVVVAEKSGGGGLLGSGLGARKKRPGVRIDMTPMVDVAFLLLIFFMVTTVFRRPLAMEVNMPEPGARVEVPESNVMTVYVGPAGDLRWKQGRGGLQALPWAALPETFVTLAKANPDLIVLVKIDRAARYETMVDMMDALDDAHMQRFSLVPLPPEEAAALEVPR